MDGGELLLLQHLEGHVAHRHDEVAGRVPQLPVHRCGVDMIVSMVAAAECRTAGGSGCEGSVEGAEVGAKNLGAVENEVEVLSNDGVAWPLHWQSRPLLHRI